MKKKSKILNKLLTALMVVLIVAALCVPAFASDISISGEWVVDDADDEGNVQSYGFMFTAPLGLVLGESYTVIWDGVEYTCVALDGSSFGSPGAFLGAVDGYPFVIFDFGVSDNGVYGVAYNMVDPLATPSFSISSNASSGSGSSSNRDYIQTPVAIPANGMYVGTYTAELIEGNTYFVSVNGVECEIVCDFYKDTDLAGYRLTDNSTFVYLQSTDSSGTCMIQGPAGAVISVYTILPEVPFVPSILDSAGNVVTSLASWVGSVARMVINTPVLLIGFTIALATLAFGIFKGLKR